MNLNMFFQAGWQLREHSLKHSNRSSSSNQVIQLRNHYENHTHLNQYPYASSKGLSNDAKNTKKSQILDPTIVQKEKFLSEYDTQAKIAN